jgi:hypothetical protein
MLGSHNLVWNTTIGFLTDCFIMSLCFFDMGLNTTVIDYSNVDACMVCALIRDPGIFR